MLGIIVLLVLSWTLLYLIEKDSILALGFLPIGKRLRQWLIGFLVTAGLCAGVQLLESLLKSSTWVWNEQASILQMGQMFWWDLRSVITEELIFRGALLVIVMRRVGERTGILLSAIAFGIYHWFSFGILGQIIPMAFIFIGTGLMGLAWALAFAKTRSIFMPIGLHLGWNFTLNSIFSKGPLGEGLLLAEGGHVISDWFSLVGLCLVPLIVFLFVKYLVPREPIPPAVDSQ